MKQQNNIKHDYHSPAVTVVAFAIEQGFAGSVEKRAYGTNALGNDLDPALLPEQAENIEERHFGSNIW